jgi:hypothetical protein
MGSAVNCTASKTDYYGCLRGMLALSLNTPHVARVGMTAEDVTSPVALRKATMYLQKSLLAVKNRANIN